MNPSVSTRLFLVSIAILLSFAGQLLVPALVSARTESLRWSHPNPQEVVRFELLFGDVQGNYTETQNLGLPTPDGQGVYTGSFDVDDGRSVYIALRAIGTSLASDPSNVQLRAGQTPSEPPTAPPPVEPPPVEPPTTPPPVEPPPVEPPTTPPPVEPPPVSSIDDPGTPNAPNPNALLRVDFSQGGASDWIDTRSNNNLSQDDSLFFVANVAGNPTLTTQSTQTNIHSHYTGNPSEFSNVQLSGRLAINHADAGIGVTLYSQYPNSDRYYRLKRDPGLPFAVSVHPHGGPGLSCATASTGVIPKVGKWYDFELTVEDAGSQNRISASIWERGTSKPASPQVVCTDPSSGRPGSGKFGAWSMGAGQKFWDDFEVVSLTETGGGVSSPPEAPILIQVVPVEQP